VFLTFFVSFEFNEFESLQNTERYAYTYM